MSKMSTMKVSLIACFNLQAKIDFPFYHLSEKEIGVLNDWKKKFKVKYPVVDSVAN